MPALRTILDFLELRPVFTLRAVQVFWWLHIAQTLYRTRWTWTTLITPQGRAPEFYNWLDFAFTPLRILVTLATARLLIEVLLAFLMPGTRQTPRDAQPLWWELWAFIDLRPFFTRWWVQVFWWLFLLLFLRTVYPYFLFAPPWRTLGTFAGWFNFFNGLLYQIIWLVGVRLLIEVALMQQAPAPRAPEQATP